MFRELEELVHIRVVPLHVGAELRLVPGPGPRLHHHLWQAVTAEVLFELPVSRRLPSQLQSQRRRSL